MELSLQPFTQADQTGFAGLSGDWNPIHVDPVAARRLLFGEPVVHGIHLVMRSLEALVGERPDMAHPAALRAVFRQPVLLGRPVRLRGRDGTAGSVVLTLETGGKTVTEIEVTPGPALPAAAVSEAGPPEAAPRSRQIAELVEDAGQVPLGVDPAALAARFPRLAAAMPVQLAATLLASTRVVGMECPGLNSLYSELELTFSDPDPAAAPTFAWRVDHASTEFRLLDIAVNAPGAQGSLRCFVRPEEARQLTMAEAAALVGAPRFAGRHALVVGGSRGLGEVAAKLLAAAGAEVSLTYASGRADAEKVAGEIRAAGATARACPLDVLDPAGPLPEGRFTHLYYFAAPRIHPGAPRGIDAALHDGFFRFFGRAFAELVARFDGPLSVVYPSTVYVETPEPGFAEYAAAKAAGETLCRYVDATRKEVTVDIWRLPRMRTDQTQSLLGATGAAPAPALWRFLAEAG